MEKGDAQLGLELKASPSSFTPVRRKESTLNHGRLNRGVKKEWNAARCNRLLRPLTSRIAILHKSKQSPGALDRIKTQSKKGKSASDSNIDASGEEMTNDNTNWIGRKKVKRTYSGKTGTKGSGQHTTNRVSSIKVSSNGRSSSVPGEIVVPTPLLNRVWRQTDSSHRAVPYKEVALGHHQQMSMEPTSDGSTKARLQMSSKAQTMGLKALYKIRHTMSPTRFNIYEGIYNGLEALLRATHPTIPKVGAKSLLSLCLINVPKYIAMEEKLLSSEIGRVGSRSAIVNRDISTEIYDELELLGSSGHGWTHLQTVVRSHGVQIICDAILEGLLDCDFCEILVDLCIFSDHHDEAELILSSLLSVCKFPAPTSVESLFSDHVAHRPLLKICKFVENTGRTGYRLFLVLIQNDMLPLQWVATAAFTPIWTGLMQDLSLDHARPDAKAFMTTVLLCLVKFVSLSDSWLDTELYGRCRSTLLSALTAISSIILLSKDDIVAKSEHATTISYTHSNLLKDCLTIIKRDAKQTDLQSTNLLLAYLVTEPNTDDISDVIIDHLHQMYAEDNEGPNADIPSHYVRKLSSAYDEAVRFIASVARCCGKGASTSGFEYLQHIHRRLEQVDTGTGLKARTIWYGIIVDSAFAFAQLAPGQKYLDYAESFDDKLHAVSSRRPDSAKKEAYHESMDFRWEEGISSWVTATPGTKISKDKATATNFESDDPGFESPSIARSQRPVGLGRGTKRVYDSGEHDQSTEPEMHLPSVSRNKTKRRRNETKRRKPASFDIYNCDSSDDELNSSYEYSLNTHVLEDIQNAAPRRRSKLVETKWQKGSPTINHEQSSFDEDELSIDMR